MKANFKKDIQYFKFCLYGFFKNLRFFEPFLILFFLEKNISFLQIGIIYSIREILINILEIPSGLLADAIGRKKTLMASFVFYIFSFLIFYFTQTYHYFILAIVFYGIGDAFRTGNHKAMIFDYLTIKGWDNQRAHYYGYTRSWSQFGSAISSLLAGGIVFISGNYKSIFLLSAIPYIMDLLLVSSYPEEIGKIKNHAVDSSFKERFIKVFREFALSFKNTYILRAVGNLSIHSGFHRSIKDYLQPIIQSLALSLPILLFLSNKQRAAILVGVTYFILYFLTAITSRKAGKLKDSLKSAELALNLTLYAGFALALISGFFYHKSFFLVSVIFYILIYLVENLRNPIGVAFVSELYKDEILATALSLNSQSKSLIAAVFAPTIGFIADKYGIGIALSTLSVLLIISSPLFIVRKKMN